MSTHALVAAISIVVGISLAAYVLFGGADFGGGVWDLLARGPGHVAHARRFAEGRKAGRDGDARVMNRLYAVEATPTRPLSS